MTTALFAALVALLALLVSGYAILASLTFGRRLTEVENTAADLLAALSDKPTLSPIVRPPPPPRMPPEQSPSTSGSPLSRAERKRQHRREGQ